MKRVTLAIALMICCIIISAQVPQGFNYQAVARDESKNPITEQIGVRFTIQSDSMGGTVFWVEEHLTITPNEFGLFNAVIGKGTRLSGLPKFSDIDWTIKPKFIMTHINHEGWKLMGSTRLWSVPYAMVADSLGGPLKKLSVIGVTDNMEEPLFEVKNTAGKTVFAVYNEGVRIYVDDGDAKGTKGGFAVGSFADTKADSRNFLYVSHDSIRAYVFDDPLAKPVKGGFAVSGFNDAKKQTNDFLLVSPDSVRVFIDKAPSTKTQKGGFAVGSFGDAKTEDEEYFRVTRDSTRIYVNEDAAKAVKGGFAVGSFAGVKGPVTTFTSLTPDNYFIGHRSGINNSSGIRNSFVGYETGVENDTGSYNVFLGYRAGYGSVSSYNTFIGYQSGSLNTTGKYNAFMGYKSGLNNKTGNNNVYIGYLAGEGLSGGSSGSRNVCLGNYAGNSITTGYQNVFIGNESGKRSQVGWQNVFIGDSAGAYTEAVGEVYIGYGVAAFPSYREEENVLIGCLAGYSFKGGYSVVIGSHSAEYGGAFKSVLIGDRAGQYSGFIDKNTRNSHTDLILVGYEAGLFNRGDNNISIGTAAGFQTRANNNIFIGNYSGYGNNGNNDVSGCSNTFIGHNSGFHNYDGKNNTGIGYEAGYSFYGDGNVFIGYQAGYNATGSNKLYIANSSTNPPLIYGDFSNGYVGIGTEEPSQFLDVNGNARFRAVGSGAFAYDLNIMSDGTLTTATSDISMKENIDQISDALDRVMKMRGIFFNWKDDIAGARQIGMIAQEVEQIIPEIVFTNPVDGLKGINYSQTSALLVEAIKEQQQQIDSYKSENDNLKSQLQSLQEEVAQIKTLLTNIGEK